MTSIQAPVDDYLRTYTYLDCRELGHPWTTQHREWLIEGTGPDRVYTKTRLCPVCSTRRVDRVNFRFESLHPVYHYPDGYKCEPGQPISRIDVRRFQIQSMLAQEYEPPANRTKRRRKGTR